MSVARLLVVVAMLTGLLACEMPAASALPSETRWHADVRSAMKGSQAYLTERAERSRGRLAVNLDIDNTMLATGYEPGKPVRVVRAFTRRAHELGIAVLVNSARRRDDLHHTARALRRAGYRVGEICLRAKGVSVPAGKKRCRRHFVREGYTIVANVGNRSTDFAGGNYERAFRLPNYHNRLS